jgi:hypothetical protein
VHGEQGRVVHTHALGGLTRTDCLLTLNYVLVHLLHDYYAFVNRIQNYLIHLYYSLHLKDGGELVFDFEYFNENIRLHLIIHVLLDSRLLIKLVFEVLLIVNLVLVRQILQFVALFQLFVVMGLLLEAELLQFLVSQRLHHFQLEVLLLSLQYLRGRSICVVQDHQVGEVFLYVTQDIWSLGVLNASVDELLVPELSRVALSKEADFEVNAVVPILGLR